MQIRQLSAIIGILVMLGATQVALGTTYYFVGDEGTGYWNIPAHWDPDDGPPGANDTAIIGEVDGEVVDMTCYVTGQQSVGTLVVKGRT